MFVVTCAKCRARYSAALLPDQPGTVRIHPSVTMSARVEHCPGCNRDWRAYVSKAREPWLLRFRIWLLERLS